MKTQGKAVFIRTPRRLQDLIRPLYHGQGQNYIIVKRIPLSGIAYENFCYDLLADRQFIEDNSHLCGDGEVWKCLFVHQRGCNDGVLVIPEMNAYVKWAAYICV